MKRTALTVAMGILLAATAIVAVGPTGVAAAASSKAPISIAFVDFESGPNSLPDRHNSLLLAINQLNAKGGVDGHTVKVKYYDSGVSSEETVTAIQHAISDHPTAIIGLQVSSGLDAAAPVLKASGIPTLQFASDVSAVKADNLFMLLATVSQTALAQAKYVASQHPKKVGLWDDSDQNSKIQMQLVQNDLKRMGVTNVVYRESLLNPSDTTQQVLDMKGTDAVISSGFPAAEALFARQLYQNGNKAPVTMNFGASTTIANKLVPDAVLANDNWVSICQPQSSTTAVAKQYVATYAAKYPTAQIVSSSPEDYDAVNVLASAIKAGGGNLSASSIVKQLHNVNYDGACGRYKTDKYQNMVHQVQVLPTNNLTKNLAVYPNLPSR